MKQTINLATLLVVALVTLLSSCANNEDKAKDFIATLTKNQKVLLSLPSSAPDCVFYLDNGTVKYYNVETEKTSSAIIKGVKPNNVKGVYAGDENIVLHLLFGYYDNQVYVFDTSAKKYEKLLSGEDVKFNKASKSFVYTTVEYTESEKITTTQKYSFDGELIDENTREEALPVYSWVCENCGETTISMTKPSEAGCDGRLFSNSGWGSFQALVSRNRHTWVKQGRVN